MKPSDVNLAELTDRLRALRLPDEEMVLLQVGSVRCRDCGPAGAIRVVAAKSGITETVEAMQLEDALLMVRAHLDDAIAARKRATEKSAKAGASA
jgi:hypothetical protein